MGMPCGEDCPYGQKCGYHFTPAMLQRAHERVYGTGVLDLGEGKYYCRLKEKETHRQWRALMLSWVSVRADDPTAPPTERFMVEGQGPVCHRYARAVYFGLDPACKDGFAHSSAWNLYIAGARAQTLAVDQDLDLLAETSVMPPSRPVPRASSLLCLSLPRVSM